MQILGIASPYGTTTGTAQAPDNSAAQWGGMGLGLAGLLLG